jgi:hypothetical protein
MEKNTAFRGWLRNIWLDNCDEHRDLGEMAMTQQEYFQKYKYWLKREFRYQNKEQNNETSMVVDSNFIMDAVLNDKLDYTATRLLSNSQNRLLKTLKDNNEK